MTVVESVNGKSGVVNLPGLTSAGELPSSVVSSSTVEGVTTVPFGGHRATLLGNPTTAGDAVPLGTPPEAAKEGLLALSDANNRVVWQSWARMGAITVTDPTYGAVADAKQVTACKIVSGHLSELASEAIAPFSPSINGKTISVEGAGVAGAPLVTTVTYINSTTLALATEATAAVAGKICWYGTLNDSALTKAKEAVGTHGATALVFPGGNYLTSATVRFAEQTNFDVLGIGAPQIICVTENNDPVILFKCENYHVDGIGVQHATQTARNSTIGIFQNECVNGTIENCSVSRVCQIGIYSQASKRLRIANNLIEKTLADGINTSGGSEEVVVIGNVLVETGDDSIPVLAYKAEANVTKSVAITGNVILKSKARGIGIVGGEAVTITGNIIWSTRGAGIHVGSHENAPTSWGVQNVTVTGNTIVEANTYESPESQRAGIHILGEREETPVKNVTVTGNTIIGGGWVMIYAGSELNGVVKTGYVTDVKIVGNHCIGPHGASQSGISLKGVTRPTVASNTVTKAMASGVIADSGCSGGAIKDNTVFLPNQSNLEGSSYGCRSASTSTPCFANLIEPDETKHALLANNSSVDTSFTVGMGGLISIAGLVSSLPGGGKISMGSGVPAKPNGENPTAGDWYFRTDEPTEPNKTAYRCTVGGATPTWVNAFVGEPGPTGPEGPPSSVEAGLGLLFDPINGPSIKLANASEVFTSAKRMRCAMRVVPKAGKITRIWVRNGTAVHGNTRVGIFDTGQAEAGKYKLLVQSAEVLQEGASAWQLITMPEHLFTLNQVVMIGVMNSGTEGSYGLGGVGTNVAGAELPEGSLGSGVAVKVPKLSTTHTFAAFEFITLAEAAMEASAQAPVLTIAHVE